MIRINLVPARRKVISRTIHQIGLRAYDPAALPDPQHVATRDLLTIHSCQIEALVRLGVAKGVWTRDEALAAIHGAVDAFDARRQGDWRAAPQAAARGG